MVLKKLRNERTATEILSSKEQTIVRVKLRVNLNLIRNPVRFGKPTMKVALYIFITFLTMNSTYSIPIFSKVLSDGKIPVEKSVLKPNFEKRLSPIIYTIFFQSPIARHEKLLRILEELKNYEAGSMKLKIYPKPIFSNMKPAIIIKLAKV